MRMCLVHIIKDISTTEGERVRYKRERDEEGEKTNFI